MRRLLIGCGIAMAFGLLAVIVMGVVTYSWWKENAPDTERLSEVRDELRETYGLPADYRPALDGTIDAERVVTFVAVREALVAPRDSIAVPIGEFLAEVAEAGEDDRSAFGEVTRGLRFAREGIRVFRDGVGYLTVRAEKLRDAGMGEGEFAYLDALALHAWLDWDPLDVIERDPLAEVGDVVDGAEEVLDRRRDLMVDQLRGARREIERLDSPSPKEAAFLETIDGALELARGSRAAFPFQSDLPEAWAAALEPHRERLARTLPRNAAQVMLEGVEHLLDEEHGGDGFTFKIDGH